MHDTVYAFEYTMCFVSMYVYKYLFVGRVAQSV